MRLPLKLLPRIGDGDEFDYGRAKTDGSFESEEKLDPRNIRERRLEFRVDIFVKFEIGHLRCGKSAGKEMFDFGDTLERSEIPGQCEEVSPIYWDVRWVGWSVVPL